MAWYQRTYFNLKFFFFYFINFKNLIYFFLFFIFFNLFVIPETVYCLKLNKPVTGYLNKCLIGGNIIYFYKDISYNVILETMSNIKSISDNNLNFNILSFKDKNGLIFPRNHPYSHPHLNFIYNFNQFNDVYITLELSSNNYNQFTNLCNKGININTNQFISDNFYMCSKKDMISEFYKFDKSLIFIEKNNSKIKTHFNLIKKSY